MMSLPNIVLEVRSDDNPELPLESAGAPEEK